MDEAVDLTRTGDVWIFRGASVADRAIRAVTNAPVNHVGMAVVLEDLPPLLWHAELGKSLPDVWTGQHQRGVQLHDLRDAVTTWRRRYGQRAWLRQLVGPADDGGVTPEMEDAVLRTIARFDGRPFPTTRAPGPRLDQRPAAPRARRRRRCSAPSSWRRPTPRWGCSAATGRATGTTRASSGPATTSSSCRARSWGRRSRSRCHRPELRHAVGALHHPAGEGLRAHVLERDVGRAARRTACARCR